MTDPTPRTAATARDALAQALTECAVPDRAGIYAEADAILHELTKNGWTLAAAASPGRVAALEAALERIRGLTDGMTVDEMSERYGSEHRVLFVIIPDIVDKALAAPASPAGVSGEAIAVANQDNHPAWSGDWQTLPDGRRWKAPAPTPSEPVGRCMECRYNPGHPR